MYLLTIDKKNHPVVSRKPCIIIHAVLGSCSSKASFDYLWPWLRGNHQHHWHAIGVSPHNVYHWVDSKNHILQYLHCIHWWLWSISKSYNTLRPEPNRWYLAGNILECIFLIENVDVFIQSLLKLVQVMAWCCRQTCHYLNQCCPQCLTSYGITRPRSVKVQPIWLEISSCTILILILNDKDCKSGKIPKGFVWGGFICTEKNKDLVQGMSNTLTEFPVLITQEWVMSVFVEQTVYMQSKVLMKWALVLSYKACQWGYDFAIVVLGIHILKVLVSLKLFYQNEFMIYVYIYEDVVESIYITVRCNMLLQTTNVEREGVMTFPIFLHYFYDMSILNNLGKVREILWARTLYVQGCDMGYLLWVGSLI